MVCVEICWLVTVCFSCVGQLSLGGLTSRRALCPTCLKCGPRVVSNVKSRQLFCNIFPDFKTSRGCENVYEFVKQHRLKFHVHILQNHTGET